MEKSFVRPDGQEITAVGLSMSAQEFQAIVKILHSVDNKFRDGEFPLSEMELDAIHEFLR